MILQLAVDSRNWIRLDQVDSTNTYAMGHPLESGVVVLAKEQTAGRGRQGRLWVSTEGSLCFSGILVFNRDLVSDDRLSLFPLLAGVSVLRAAQALTNGLTFRIKEPNDVLIIRDGKPAKVAGVLVESEIRSEARKVVIGVGVNLRQAPESSDSVYPPASLLGDHSKVSPEEFAASLIQEFNARSPQIVGPAQPAFLGEVAEFRLSEQT